jgi:copper oxidase (laccase) domain-containing protein
MKIIVAISKVDDGNMSNGLIKADKKIIENRTSFLANNKINIHQTTKVAIAYNSENYCRYIEVFEKDKGKGMKYSNIDTADALITCEINHALFLPIADCVGAVIYDPKRRILMVSHLGRHSLEQNGGYESVKFMIDNYKCDPSNLLVWLTPAPGPDVYPMYAFNNQSIKYVVFHQLQSAGILKNNITDNPADTSKDLDYFSHSEFLKGNQLDDGRFAIVAMMKN